jgi:hypothetical protein
MVEFTSRARQSCQRLAGSKRPIEGCVLAAKCNETQNGAREVIGAAAGAGARDAQRPVARELEETEGVR